MKHFFSCVYEFFLIVILAAAWIVIFPFSMMGRMLENLGDETLNKISILCDDFGDEEESTDVDD